MSNRSDVNINWQTSPRIFGVDYPSSELTVQDLHDSATKLEEDQNALDDPKTIDSAGKENLGGGVEVGITSTLLDMQVAFDSGIVSPSSGTVTTPDSTGITLTDSAADFTAEGVVPGDTLINYTDKSVGTVLTVGTTSLTLLRSLRNGSDNQFDSADEYVIYTTLQCEVSGGNVVALDGVGADINAVFPTAFTQVVRTAASSATATSQTLLEHASFNGQVTLDTDSSYTYADNSSTVVVGTELYPVNNLSDALIISGERGFTTIKILRDMTFNSGSNLDGFTIEGSSATETQIIIDASATATNMTIKNCDVAGTLDGSTTLEECNVGNLVYFNGFIQNSGLYGTIYLDGNENAVLESCYTIDQALPPSVDMGGTGQSLAMPNYSGIMTISNLTDATANVGIGLLAGAIVLDSTVTAGNFIIAGTGILSDNSTSITSLNTDGLINTENITKTTWDTVYIDTNSGTAGTAFPIGTSGTPVSNITQGRIIANANSINKFIFSGTLVLDQPYANWSFTGQGSNQNNAIIFTGVDTSGTLFENAYLTGTAIGNYMQYVDCIIDDLTGINGSVNDSPLDGTITLTGPGDQLIGVVGMIGGPTIIDFSSTPNVAAIKIFGAVQISNLTAGSFCQIGIEFGSVVLDPTCSGGTAIIEGNGSLLNISTGATVFDYTTATLAPAATADAVWDEDITTHTTADSAGKLAQDVENKVDDNQALIISS